MSELKRNSKETQKITKFLENSEKRTINTRKTHGCVKKQLITKQQEREVKIMKLFISQPMKDKTNEEIKTEREKIIEAVTNKFGEVEVIDSFFENAPHDAKPLWFLGKSLELLSAADIAYFASDWNEYRGCKIEHTCALEYGIEVMHFDD